MALPRNAEVYISAVDYAKAVEVRIVTRTPEASFAWYPTEENDWESHLLHEGTPFAPSLRFDGRTFENLLKAAQGVIDPSTATERHLKDALNVRDQLLEAVLKSAH